MEKKEIPSSRAGSLKSGQSEWPKEDPFKKFISLTISSVKSSIYLFDPYFIGDSIMHVLTLQLSLKGNLERRWGGWSWTTHVAPETRNRTRDLRKGEAQKQTNLLCTFVWTLRCLEVARRGESVTHTTTLDAHTRTHTRK